MSGTFAGAVGAGRVGDRRNPAQQAQSAAQGPKKPQKPRCPGPESCPPGSAGNMMKPHTLAMANYATGGQQVAGAVHDLQVLQKVAPEGFGQVSQGYAPNIFVNTVRVVQKPLLEQYGLVVGAGSPALPVAARCSVVCGRPRSCPPRCMCLECKHRRTLRNEGPSWSRCGKTCEYCLGEDKQARALLDLEFQKFDQILSLGMSAKHREHHVCGDPCQAEVDEVHAEVEGDGPESCCDGNLTAARESPVREIVDDTDGGVADSHVIDGFGVEERVAKPTTSRKKRDRKKRRELAAAGRLAHGSEN